VLFPWVYSLQSGISRFSVGAFLQALVMENKTDNEIKLISFIVYLSYNLIL